MWYIITSHKLPKFYLVDGSVVEPAINWVYSWQEGDKYYHSSEPVIAEPTQALAALNAANVMGYRTKAEAREVAKGMGIRLWKYLRVG